MKLESLKSSKFGSMSANQMRNLAGGNTTPGNGKQICHNGQFYTALQDYQCDGIKEYSIRTEKGIIWVHQGTNC